jgi:hypothetical protein
MILKWGNSREHTFYMDVLESINVLLLLMLWLNSQISIQLFEVGVQYIPCPYKFMHNVVATIKIWTSINSSLDLN